MNGIGVISALFIERRAPRNNSGYFISGLLRIISQITLKKAGLCPDWTRIVDLKQFVVIPFNL
jgi:hypothetical protein